MTNEQIIELAKQAGITFITQSGVASATEEWLVEFARLVGNAKLEEAAKVCDKHANDKKATVPQQLALDIASDDIRSLKK